MDSVTSIKDIVSRYYKDEQLCQVSYAIELSDGRMIRLDIPESRDLTEAEAKENARRQAETYMVRLFIQEKNTGKYACCGGLTAYGPSGHLLRCPAITR